MTKRCGGVDTMARTRFHNSKFLTSPVALAPHWPGGEVHYGQRGKEGTMTKEFGTHPGTAENGLNKTL